MTMGSRIRQARMELGLSQRQLAGEEITRNMLSALENDGANPSVGTLKYLADRLGKPVSYFLGESLPGEAEMAGAREAFRKGEYRACLEFLENVGMASFSAEKGLLAVLSAMALADDAIRDQRLPYAKRLLEQAWASAEGNPYFTQAQQRQWKLLYARAGGPLTLTGEDEALLLRARAALEDGDVGFAVRLLEAVEQRNEEWNYLRGEAHFGCREYPDAARCYHNGENKYPADGRLEVCYREMEDYKMAYFYAKKKEENR